MLDRLNEDRPLVVRSGGELLALPCLFMRGGSSRGAFIRRSDLPEEIARRDAILLAAYGSPDHRQIDGIGGGDPLTSKAALIERSARSDADVEYTFCQVGIDQPQVTTGGNCGNMLAAVGPYAILTGLMPATEPTTCVRIYVTNIDQVITAHVPVVDGMPAVDGDCAVPGVPDSGARISLDFGDCSGSVTGKLLPTNEALSRIELSGRLIDVSLVDAATSFVFVGAADVGAGGTESPAQIAASPEIMNALEDVRGWAAVTIGLVKERKLAQAQSPNLPRVIMVSEPADYTDTSGRMVRQRDVDIVVRQMAMQRPHKALAVTGAVCTAVAGNVAGSLVARLTGGKSRIRIGHPGGILEVQASTTTKPDGSLTVTRAVIDRTARLIMSGTLHVRASKIEALYNQLVLARTAQ